MKILTGVIIAIVIAVLCILGFIYSGIYNVAATSPDSPLVAWILQETRESSVRSRASGLKVPAGFDKINTDRVYFVFHSICATCHGGSGPVSNGLNPYAPNLAESARELSPQAIFWIVRNGIKMTGMPAFGKTYADDEVWMITAFVKQLPKTTAEPKR